MEEFLLIFCLIFDTAISGFYFCIYTFFASLLAFGKAYLVAFTRTWHGPSLYPFVPFFLHLGWHERFCCCVQCTLDLAILRGREWFCTKVNKGRYINAYINYGGGENEQTFKDKLVHTYSGP